MRIRLQPRAAPPITSKVVDSLFVGESDNIGNPTTPAEKAYGRSLPYPESPISRSAATSITISATEVNNVTFVNYEDNATRKAGALSYLLYTSFGMSTENSVEGVKFVNAKPVYFPPMERKWGNDNGSGAGWSDRGVQGQGRLGRRRSQFLHRHQQRHRRRAMDSCQIKPTWNAAVCKGDLGRMNVGAPRAGGAGPGAGAARWCGLRVPVLVPVRLRALVPARVQAGPGAGPGAAVPVLAPGAGGPGGFGGPGAAAGPGGPAPGGFGGAGGPGARGGGAPAAPPQPPIVLSRKGKEFTATGETFVVAGTEVKVTTERPTVSLGLSQLDPGSWVIFELPGFTTAAAGTQQSSLDALRKADATSYYKGNDALWVKVVAAALPLLLPVAAPAVVAVAALVVEPACRSAGELTPA